MNADLEWQAAMSEATSTELARVDVERVRFSAEHDALAEMARHHHNRRVTFVGIRGEAKRRQLLSRSLLLTESMAEIAHRARRTAAERLGVSDPIELFQSSSTFDSVRLAVDEPMGIEFLGGYLATLDEPQLLAVIGHEIGHCIAQTRDARFAWALSASQEANTPSSRAYAKAAEITADRFGLLACRDLDAVLRLEMQAPAGKSGIRLDTGAYLAQCQELVASLVASGKQVWGSTHPEHYVRGYAEWLFTETDVYAALTGVGRGTRRLEDVDRILRDLLGILPAPLGGAADDTPDTIASAPAAPVPLGGTAGDALRVHVHRLASAARKAALGWGKTGEKPGREHHEKAAAESSDLVGKFADHVRRQRQKQG
jgi:hypothetical protein